jgi:hypothetical protein
MLVSQLYNRGYALGTGAKVRNVQDGDTYVLANVDEYKWCAINVRTGDRHRDICPFQCSFQADLPSIIGVLGRLEDWEVVASKVIEA